MPPKESSPARMGSICESETERVQILLISKNVLQIVCTCLGDAVQNSAIRSEIQFQQDIELSIPIGAAQHRIMLHTPSRFWLACLVQDTSNSAEKETGFAESGGSEIEIHRPRTIANSVFAKNPERNRYVQGR